MSLNARFKFSHSGFAMDVDLLLPSKGVSAIYGSSGSGKTSLLRAIAGLDHHTSGQCSLDDRVWQLDQRFVPAHQRGIAMVFQNANLFGHLTVKGNIDYAAKRAGAGEATISPEQAIELLGIESLLNRTTEKLSGGEKQRVAIARALASNPSLLLLDEPLSALDQSARRSILPYLESLHNELTLPMVYVSHVLEELTSIADHLVLMNSGKVTAAGPLTETLTRLDTDLAYSDSAESIIDAVVAKQDQTFGLSYLDTAAGRFSVSQSNLEIGSKKRIRVAARDVSITLEHAHSSSILNIFTAVIIEQKYDDASQVLLKLDLNGDTLLARITRKSASLLDLKIGQSVFVQIKSIALL